MGGCLLYPGDSDQKPLHSICLKFAGALIRIRHHLHQNKRQTVNNSLYRNMSSIFLVVHMFVEH